MAIKDLVFRPYRKNSVSIKLVEKTYLALSATSCMNNFETNFYQSEIFVLFLKHSGRTCK